MSRSDNFYLEAVEKTEEVFAPAVGFASEVNTSTIIKQNNTIIELLVQINRKLDRTVGKAPAPEGLGEIIDRLGSLQITPSKDKIPKRKGDLAVWQDPNQLVANFKKK